MDSHLEKWVKAHPKVSFHIGDRSHSVATTCLMWGLLLLRVRNTEGITEYCIHENRMAQVHVEENVVQITTKDGLRYTLGLHSN